VFLSIFLGLLIYLSVLAFYFPKHNSYDNEVFYILVGFGGVGGLILSPLFASYAVRLILNLIDILVWHNKMKLVYTTTTKVMLWLVPLLLVVGIPVSFHPKQNVWGWFIWFLGLLVFIIYVHYLWLINYYFQRSNKESQHVASSNATR
jgi:hypothetical protein